MKVKLNVMTLALAALCVVDETLAQGAGSSIGTPMQGGDMNTLPYGERAKSIFEKIADWTPGQLKNAVEVGEAKALRDPQGNTLLHRAIETGNIGIVELLHNEYGFVGTYPNSKGETAFDLASRAGEEFAGVFGDVQPVGVAV
jgi:hypothetical protein